MQNICNYPNQFLNQDVQTHIIYSSLKQLHFTNNINENSNNNENKEVAGAAHPPRPVAMCRKVSQTAYIAPYTRRTYFAAANVEGELWAVRR